MDCQEQTATVAPVVISASRATDIPAYYADWFMNRLRAGGLRWRNPFNARQVRIVSLAKVRVIVFWTKDPVGLLPHLDELDRRGVHYLFQYTLNDYEAERLEPNLPGLEDRLAVFRRLADRLGPDRVVWRLDPLLLTDRTDVPALLEKADHLAVRLSGCVRKLVFSFADILAYPAVKRNLARSGSGAREFNPEEMRAFSRGLADLNRAHGFELATCAEEVDLATFGIARNRCVDGALLARLWPEDAGLMEYLGSGRARKDKGQRLACGCLASKDIGRYRTCPRGCGYCYANGTPAEAERNFRSHRPEHETI